MSYDGSKIHRLLQMLHQQYGDQNWWPGDSPFEVMAGAILTQNTSWKNVEKALANLKKHEVLDPRRIVNAPHDQLAGWLRPSGYFNIKSKRLKNYCRWYLDQGGFSHLEQINTAILRQQLLKLNGIGPETADSILLYAFHKPVFVIDRYTRRLFTRLGYIKGDESYEALRSVVEKELGEDVRLLNELHALIVAHGKARCNNLPHCEDCGLRGLCTLSGQYLRNRRPRTPCQLS